MKLDRNSKKLLDIIIHATPNFFLSVPVLRGLTCIEYYCTILSTIIRIKGGCVMLAANFSTVRENLKSYCDKVTNNGETLIVTRKDEKNVVLMSLEEYNIMQKKLRNAEYLEKLDKSIEQLRQGKVVVKTMEELEAMENE